MVQLQSGPVSTAQDQLPEIVGPVPGPRSRALAQRLARVESQNVTQLSPQPPIFWERAAGANVWDADGNRYVDLGAGFGVANAGHAHPRVVEAVRATSSRLLHVMGDFHPAALKVELLEALARHFPGGGEVRGILGCSGSDAVEAALESALLATDRPGVIAFEGGYHGLSLGARDVSWRPAFRDPFAKRLPGATAFADFGNSRDVLRAARQCSAPVGAVIVEPIQGRGGERIPPPGFLSELREVCDAEGWLLIVDEVYTGFGRTGRWFACEHEDVVPDLLCVAKGLASGMPISACLGRGEVMRAWPVSDGEAIRTQTFLGHPPSCAAALASIEVLEEEKLPERAARVGALALAHLQRRFEGLPGVVDVRGRGLLLAVECAEAAQVETLFQRGLERGIISLPSGDEGRTLSLAPPLTIAEPVLEDAIDRLAKGLP
jgi:4-aminobutyrate aminotransferase/(S)-3-amino-2-methylpropionate transaminase